VKRRSPASWTTHYRQAPHGGQELLLADLAADNRYNAPLVSPGQLWERDVSFLEGGGHGNPASVSPKLERAVASHINGRGTRPSPHRRRRARASSGWMDHCPDGPAGPMTTRSEPVVRTACTTWSGSVARPGTPSTRRPVARTISRSMPADPGMVATRSADDRASAETIRVFAATATEDQYGGHGRCPIGRTGAVN
jgi:hypothetical protein